MFNTPNVGDNVGDNQTDYHSPNAAKISLLALSTAEVSSTERYITQVSDLDFEVEFIA